MQVAHARVAACGERGVEVRDQGTQPQALVLVAADQDAVGAFIGHHLHRCTFGGRRALVERVHDPHHFGRPRVLQRHDLHVLVSHLVDALDDAHDARHVVGVIGDDEDVGGGVGDQVPVLRNHRPQNRHQLRCADVPDVDHLGHDLVRARAHAIGQIDARQLARVRVGQDLDHVPVPGWHGDEAIHLEDRQERLVERRRRHRRRGQHGHLRPHPRVDDEVLAGRRADRFCDLGDVRVLEIRRDALPRLLRRGERGAEEHRERAHCKGT